MKNSG